LHCQVCRQRRLKSLIFKGLRLTNPDNCDLIWPVLADVQAGADGRAG
jgi:hypothetical protein